MIELVIEQYLKLKDDKRFVFVINQSDCDSYHLDRSLNLICDKAPDIVKIRGETRGAACSALMAIQHINDDNELLIVNSDQLIDANINNLITALREKNADAGVVIFDSIHPKWSYVRRNAAGKVIETAEKKPISRSAIAGFYYFRKGKDFVWAAMKSIEKGASVNDVYFIAPTLNELILENKNIETVEIAKEDYHSFYSPQKIQEFLAKCNEGRSTR